MEGLVSDIVENKIRAHACNGDKVRGISCIRYDRHWRRSWLGGWRLRWRLNWCRNCIAHGPKERVKLCLNDLTGNSYRNLHLGCSA